MFRIERGPLLVQTLAVCLAARAFAETEFVTDKLGAEMAARLGWSFGQVSTPLEAWPTDGLTHIWALGKLVACTLQEQPFVQFDGDVLLFKPLPKRLTRCRLIAQSPDFPNYYTSADMQAALAVAGFGRNITAYNGGLLGGSDVALVRAYAWAGLELAKQFRGSAINGTTTSMIVEQYQLGVFARRVGVEVGTLLPLHPTRKQIAKAGYSHLSGSAKREPQWVERVEARIARDFPEAYARFLDAWPHVVALASNNTGAAGSGFSASEPTIAGNF